VSQTYASLVSVNDGDTIYLPLRSYVPIPTSVVQSFIPSTTATSLHPITSVHSPLADYFLPYQLKVFCAIFSNFLSTASVFKQVLPQLAFLIPSLIWPAAFAPRCGQCAVSFIARS